MTEIADINPELENRIISIIEEGNRHEENKDYDKAILAYETAWDLIPEPKLNWTMISPWICACFLGAHMEKHSLLTAKKWAEMQLETPFSDIDVAPYFDIGMVCYELKQYSESFYYFDKVFSMGKERPFKERPKKYFDFYLSYKQNNS